MSTYPDGCTCMAEGYDECVCRFRWICGFLGHTKIHCEERSRKYSEEWYYWDEDCLSEPPEYVRLISNAAHTKLPVSQLSKGKILPKNTQARKSWKVHAGIAIELQSLGPINRGVLLAYLISEVQVKMEGRYSSLLEKYDVFNILEEGLNPAERDICENGNFDLENLIKIGENPETSKDAGIYLHIMWRKSNPSSFWLYIGQASEFCVRIKTHKDPWRRHKNPSLHYYVWDSELDMQSEFVRLATYRAPSCSEDHLMLNLGEMWMCLIFQTLTSFHLDQFLSKDVKSLWAGHHLNVALPLWQGFTDTKENKDIKEANGGRINFQHHLKSEDLFIRAWAEHARDAFNDIRNSPNPALRKYYRDILEKRLAKARETWAAKKTKRAMQAVSGTREKITVSHGGEHVEVKSGMFKFTVSKRLGLDLRHGDTVVIQYHLTATQHPKPYAARALPTDPASRLGVSIRGQDKIGAFHCWLETNGSCNVLKMNSLVDVLEGFSLEQSKNFKRRWFTRKVETSQGQKKRKDHVYT